jgi:phosphohistidine swiveling domain-containing protein
VTDRTTETTAAPSVTFDPPAPGQWELETAHHGLRPLSPFLRDTYRRAFEAGIVEPMQRYGLPLVTVQAKFVHGCLYMRPLAVGEKPGSTPKAPPPAWLMKLIVRLHPELRRRATTARQAFAERRWRDEVDQWFDRDRSAQLAANLALQAVEPGMLDDVELAAHVATVRSHFERSARRNLATHGGDLVPTGDLLAHCERWGIAANEVAGLLTGSSPATVETAVMLGPVASAIRHSGVPRASLETVDDVRALGADARAAVDTWLQQHMWRTVTSDDVDRATLAEVPSLQLAALLGATEHLDVGEPDVAAVRDRVPGEHRALFDDLLAEARYGHRQRDDIRGLCWNWPCGLVRRALLEAGRRLHAAGGVHEVAHVVELFPDELDRVLLGRVRQGAGGPSADELAERAAERDRIEATPPPRLLGAPEPAPELDVFPKALARVTEAIMANLRADVTPPPPADEDSSTVTGIGIGDAPYSGRACVVRDLMLALDQLQPGDVLVAPFTGPSVNSLLPVIGALVVEEGGALCHAAIVAREFGLAAVIGAHRATSCIPHGAQVEVDPAHGTVRLL